MTDAELESQLERVAFHLERTDKPSCAKVVRAAIARLGELQVARSLDDAGILAPTGRSEGLFSRLFGGDR